MADWRFEFEKVVRREGGGRISKAGSEKVYRPVWEHRSRKRGREQRALRTWGVGARKVCVRLLSWWWKNMMDSAGGGGGWSGVERIKKGWRHGCERVRGVGRILFWE